MTRLYLRCHFRRHLCLLPLALLGGVPLSAQAPATPKEALQCEALRHKGDPASRDCYQRLTRASDPATAAEGFWGIGDFRSANDSFRAAVKLRDADPAPRVRWGRMYLDHWQASEASGLFGEALKIKEDYAPALLGMALVAGEQFEGAAIKSAEKALAADPKLYEADEVIARVHLDLDTPMVLRDPRADPCR